MVLPSGATKEIEYVLAASRPLLPSNTRHVTPSPRLLSHLALNHIAPQQSAQVFIVSSVLVASLLPHLLFTASTALKQRRHHNASPHYCAQLLQSTVRSPCKLFFNLLSAVTKYAIRFQGTASSTTMLAATDSNRVRCTYPSCDLHFDSEKTMKQHKKHDDDHDYCHKCDEDFESYDDLAFHKIYKPDIHNKACRVCGAEFKSDSGLKRHIELVRNATFIEVEQC